MTHRRIFWIVFAALGLGGAALGVSLFSEALPTISLDIRMDRAAALDSARAMAEGMGWGPQGARLAASFGQVDPEVQTYVELEGGGREVFQGLMDAGDFQPYQWRVRRFAEGEVEEVEVRFTPGGAPYGFRRTLAEDDPGTGNLAEAEAEALARAEAARWGVELAAYRRLEASERTHPGGRVDHTFVYERDDLTVNEARFRLRLVVAGSDVAELTHFVFVPEAFSRRYAEMRSTNDTIALVAQGVFMVLFVLLGAGVGSALLLRAGWLEWRPALRWGGVVAVLFGLNALNALPLAWMQYDTALSARTFVLQNLAAALAIAALGTPLLAFVFMAGESLGRRAFPGHLQQWKFWAPEVAASRPALGLTVSAYLLVGLQVGYVVLFYLGTSRLEGWWSPADALVQPDLLATYAPWLQAVSISLFAAFWEESVFRAVPIACAALLGARYGRRNLWIWGAVLLQAVVFAAGHANYPQQPAYARVVELTPPALLWGAVYVGFGLVPTILAHFLYDLALFSSVLFVSHAPLDQAVVVLLALVPLGVAVWARRGGRARAEVPDWAYNRAWRPGARPAAGTEGPESSSAPPGSAPAVGPTPADVSTPALLRPAALATVALAGFALWVGAMLARGAPPRLEVGRAQAEALARDALTTRGHDLTGWRAAATAGNGRGQAHVYVVRELGRDSVEALLGTFLAPPQWIVRFVNWDAPPEERAEEFLVNLEVDGTLRRIAHRLPEGRPGASLPEDSARALARAVLWPGTWEEVAAEETAREARTDWTFTFRDPTRLTGVEGEARAVAEISGAEVTDLRRFVHVPEAWARAYRQSETRRTMLSLGLALALVILYGTGAVTAVVLWSRGRLVVGPLRVAAPLLGAAMVLGGANAWPATTSAFVTAQPYGFQAGAVAFGIGLAALVITAGVSLVVALGHSWIRGEEVAPAPRSTGPALGLALAGLSAAGAVWAAELPPLPDYSGAATWVATLAPPLEVVLPVFFLTSGMLALAAARRRFRRRPALRAVTGFAVLAFGMVAVPGGLQESIPVWFLAGLAAAAALAAVLEVVARHPRLAPEIFGSMIALQTVEHLLAAPFPGSVPGYALAVVVVILIVRWWSRALDAPTPAGTAAEAT